MPFSQRLVFPTVPAPVLRPDIPPLCYTSGRSSGMQFYNVSFFFSILTISKRIVSFNIQIRLVCAPGLTVQPCVEQAEMQIMKLQNTAPFFFHVLMGEVCLYPMSQGHFCSYNFYCKVCCRQYFISLTQISEVSGSSGLRYRTTAKAYRITRISSIRMV